MTDKQLEIARKCIYACETGGQVYGNARYDCYVGNHTNSDKETACTIGASGNHAGTAKKLMQSILEKYPSSYLEEPINVCPAIPPKPKTTPACCIVSSS